MENISFAREARPHAIDGNQEAVTAPRPRFTPGQFLREAGTLIAVCLVLGLLAQILVGS